MVTKQKKEEISSELGDKLGRTKLAIVLDYRGLTVRDAQTLRRRLHKEHAELKIAKNTLIRRAARGVKALRGLEQFLSGPTALALGYTDSPAPAKVLSDFIREVKKTGIRGGMLAGQAMTPEQVKSLADLPSREILLAKLLGTMQAPLSGLLAAMSGLPRNLVYALEQVRQQKEGAATD